MGVKKEEIDNHKTEGLLCVPCALLFEVTVTSECIIRVVYSTCVFFVLLVKRYIQNALNKTTSRCDFLRCNHT